MSDNLRRYRAIRDALIQGYPGQLPGPSTRHLTTLAALISGIGGSKRTPLPHIATQVPDGTQAESRVKRFARWVRNDRITEEVYCVPYAQVLLAHLALQTLVLIMDGSVVGRGCVALMMHVVYKGRALPLAWQGRQGKKGHFPADLHIALVKQVQTLIPLGAAVVVLGDGEFDGTTSSTPYRTLIGPPWSARGVTSPCCGTGALPKRDGSGLYQTGDPGCAHGCTHHGSRLWPGDAPLLLGQRLSRAAASEHAYPSADEACRLYAKRFRIETFFSDQKSRGFHLHQSHLADPTRLARLLMAAC